MLKGHIKIQNKELWLGKGRVEHHLVISATDMIDNIQA